jgi:hypothetical protein
MVPLAEIVWAPSSQSGSQVPPFVSDDSSLGYVADVEEGEKAEPVRIGPEVQDNPLDVWKLCTRRTLPCS